jgi:hypothetical protein
MDGAVAVVLWVTGRASKKIPTARGSIRPREIRENVGASKTGVLGIEPAIISVTKLATDEKEEMNH